MYKNVLNHQPAICSNKNSILSTKELMKNFDQVPAPQIGSPQPMSSFHLAIASPDGDDLQNRKWVYYDPN